MTNTENNGIAPVTDENKWMLRLYVAGQTPKAITAYANLKKICEEHLQGSYQIEVIDLLVNPTLAKDDQILALPTLGACRIIDISV